MKTMYGVEPWLDERFSRALDSFRLAKPSPGPELEALPEALTGRSVPGSSPSSSASAASWCGPSRPSRPCGRVG